MSLEIPLLGEEVMDITCVLGSTIRRPCPSVYLQSKCSGGFTGCHWNEPSNDGGQV